MKLDREQGTKAINEGFVMIFGEQHRELLETKGEELIELGIKNGKNWVDAQVLKSCYVSVYFSMCKKGIIKQEEIDKLKKELQIYLTKEDINILEKGIEVPDSSYTHSKGLGKYITLFSEKIPESDVKIVSPTPFDHFKEYIIDDHYKITLFGESGLQLDSYKKKNLKYYKEEGELCYMVEDIARKYHYFGMLLAKNEQLELWIEKIKNNLNENDHHGIHHSLINIIYKLCNNKKDADKIIIDIQNHTGITEGKNLFMTHDQVTKSLSRIK